MDKTVAGTWQDAHKRELRYAGWGMVTSLTLLALTCGLALGLRNGWFALGFIPIVASVAFTQIHLWRATDIRVGRR